MSKLNIAIISDLHCHHSSAGYSDSILLSDLPRRPENQHPVSSLDILIRDESLRADVVLMPGDMANKADIQGMNTAWDFIKKIGISLKASIISSTLGNHDVIWKEQVDDSFKIARDLLPLFPTDNLDQYQSFWANGYYFEEQSDYRILVVNSVKHQSNEKAAKRGLISNEQLDGISNYLRCAEKKMFQIAVCHHHPIQHEEIDLGPNDLMENGSRLVELLSSFAFNVLVHGHKHHPRLKIDSSGGHALAIFAAGSFSACMTLGLGTRARNVFHLLEIEKDDLSGMCKGSIKTWQFQHQRGWTKSSHNAADFPHNTGFGNTSSPEQAALVIEAEFKSQGSDAMLWSKITDAHPDLNFLPPSNLCALASLLKSRGYEFTPEAPDKPVYIGVPR
jgi:hypothetical protein